MPCRRFELRTTLGLAFAIALLGLRADSASAQLAIGGQFDPSGSADNCGLGFDSVAKEVWVHGCSSGLIHRYSTGGTLLGSVARPGEAANDVDVELAKGSFALGATVIPTNTLLFINGETAAAEVYAVDKVSGAVLSTLNTAFGASHVVGGAYHQTRQTLFLVQDKVAGATAGNRIAEVDPATGAVLNSFQVAATFSVNFGDLEVCNTTGNLLLVSSDEARVAEYSPTGTFLRALNLPVGVANLAGIGIDESTGDLWVTSSSSGIVWRLSGGPCAATPVPALSVPAVGLLATILVLASVLALRRLPRTHRS